LKTLRKVIHSGACCMHQRLLRHREQAEKRSIDCHRGAYVVTYAPLWLHSKNGKGGVNSKDYPPERHCAKDNVHCYM
jgi:hypothetical protein